jgi:uncharacterized BrkB/YihY/UPF0761 family membrane protein
VDSALADFPVIGAQLRHNVHALGGSGIALVVGLVVLLWGSLGVANALQDATAEMWNVPVHQRPRFSTRVARAALLLLTVALGVIAATLGSTALAIAGSGVALDVLGVTLALCLDVALYLAGLRILTTRTISVRLLCPGALLGGVAWTALQLAGAWLVARQLRHTSELYGFFAIVLGLLFWLYLAAQVFVLATEVNVVTARRLWPRSLASPPLTPADEQTFAAMARAEARNPHEEITVDFD